MKYLKGAISLLVLFYSFCLEAMDDTSDMSDGSLEAVLKIDQRLFSLCEKTCCATFSDMGIDIFNGNLYAHAFNVGQANFIVLNKGEGAVIIDAGSQYPISQLRDSVGDKLDELLLRCTVEAVFITHPHKDHFSLFTENDNLLNLYGEKFAKTKFYLGGSKTDWESRDAGSFLGKIKNGQFLDNSHQEIADLLGGDVHFRVFGVNAPSIRAANKLSLLIQVGFHGMNMLFLGDAEGDSLSRLLGTLHDLASAKSLVPSRKDEINGINKKLKQRVQAYKSFIESSALYRSYWKQIGSGSTLHITQYESLEEGSLSCLVKKCTDLSALLEDGAALKASLTSLAENLESIRAKTEDAFEEDFINLNTPSFVEFSSRYWQLYEMINGELDRSLLGLENILEKDYISNVLCDNEEFMNSFRGDFEAVFDSLAENAHFVKILIAEALPYILSEVVGKDVEMIHSTMEYFGIQTLQKRNIQRIMNGIIAEIEDPLSEDTSKKSEDFRAVVDFFSIFKEHLKSKIINDKTFLLYMIDAYFRAFPVTRNQLIWRQLSGITKNLIHTIAMRDLFKDSQIIFLPHHGTNTKNSQNILGFFAGRIEPRAFVVSSSPFGNNQLPKASTLDMAPAMPKHLPHPFLYCRDFIPSVGAPQLKETTKPIYLTGAAPAGVITMMIPNMDEKVGFILDLIPRDSALFRWIDILTGKVG
jgi:beta-lactamase superfamily II metal-dependent hydrolase